MVYCHWCYNWYGYRWSGNWNNLSAVMPDWTEAYDEQVLKARNAIMGKTGKTAQAYLKIYRVIGQAIIDFRREVRKKNITDLRSATVHRNLKALLDGLERQIPAIVDAELRRAIERSIQAHRLGLEEAIRAVNPSKKVVKSIRGTVLFTNPQQIVTNAMEYYPIRQGFSSSYQYRTLINEGLAQLQDDLDRLIGSAIQRGISADNLTKEMAVMLSKNDPEFNRVLRQLGPRGGRLRNAMKGVDLSQPQIDKAKKFLTKMRRIAVSEINNAYTEADRLSSIQSKVVRYNRWEVSGKHWGVYSTPDSCTFNYEVDQYGLGKGVFYPETTPALMHPFCGCWCSKKYAEPEQWLEPAPNPESPNTFSERGYRRFFKGKTTAHRNRNIDKVNRMNELAYWFYQKYHN